MKKNSKKLFQQKIFLQEQSKEFIKFECKYRKFAKYKDKKIE